MAKFFVGLLFSIFFLSCVYHDTNPEVIQPSMSCDTISWQKHILPIMVTSCATDGCHNGISRLDWRDHALAKQYASQIKSKTQDRSMPFDSSISQQQIDLIACWVDGGAQEN